MPREVSFSKLNKLGESYHLLRLSIFESKKIGLTSTYNLFHNADVSDENIIKLRELHRKIDYEIAVTYGWNDLDFKHDYYCLDYLPKNDCIRFTISEKARNEVFDRLTALNKERHQKEQKELGVVRLPKKSTKYKMAASDSEFDKFAEPKPQMSFFDDTASASESTVIKTVKGNQWGAESIDQILAWLEDKAPNWYTKEAILTACGTSVADWQPAVDELLNDGDIESKLVDSILRYRAAE